MTGKIKNKLKKILTTQTPKLLKQNSPKSNKLKNSFNIFFFGNKNKNKFFYVIRRSPGAGFFSNLTHILYHLKIADKYKFIPVVDMKNFLTIYNEDKSILKTRNAWLYYFEQTSKYSLNEVYSSNKVIISSNVLYLSVFG